AVWLQVLHNDTLGIRQLVAVGHVRRDAANVDTELTFLRLGLFATLLLIAQAGSKELGTVSDGDATGDSINAGHRRIGDGVELHANRTARNFVVRSDQLVVNLHHGVGRHRETDALVSSAP